MSINRKLGDLANVLDDGTEGQVLSFNASGKIAASTISTESTLGTLTQSFDSNQTSSISLSSAVNTVPYVSVFKEVPQQGVTSKGQWDVNSNATNYDFFDEKPYSTYASSTLTPSATGDGTFTSSNPIETSYDFSNPTAGATSTYTAPDWHVFAFNTTGTKLLSLDSGYLKLKSYNLSTAWDITTINSSAGAESTISTGDIYGTTISADGTKLIGYHSGIGYIYEYTMSTPFDVTTLTASGSTSSLGGASTSGAFNWFIKPGTYDTAYALINRHLYKYTFTGGSIITGTVTRDANFLDLDPANQKNYINSGQLQFKPDGTEFYIGQGTDSIIERWVLSTAWDITTATKSSDTVPFTTAGNIWLKPDGTKIYYVDDGNSKRIDEYNIGSSLAFNAADVGKKVVGNSGSAIITGTSGTYTSVTAFADTSAISSWQLFGAQGKADGSGIELTSIGGGYDFPNLSYTGRSFYLTGAVATLTTAEGMSMKPDGTKIWVLDRASDKIVEFSLSTPYEIDTASSTGTTLNILSYESAGTGIHVNSEGTRLIIIGSNQDEWNEFHLSTGWDLTTATHDQVTSIVSITSGVTAPQDLVFNDDGTRMFIVGANTDKIFGYTLSTAFDISTLTSAGELSIASIDGTPGALSINNDGTELYISGTQYDNLQMLKLDTAYDLSSYNASESLTYSWTSDGTGIGTTAVEGITISKDGTKLYLTSAGEYIYEYDFGAAGSSNFNSYSPALTNSSTGQINSSSWLDINSMTADETKNDGDIFYAVSTDNRTSWSVAKASDGVRKIAKNNSGTWQYNNDAGTTVGYDLSNASYASVYFSPTSQTLDPRGVAFNSDGTKLYVASAAVWQYSLSSAYDISNPTYENKTFSFSSQDAAPSGIQFNNDGTKLYMSGASNHKVFQYSLSSAYDVSTASYDSKSLSSSSVLYGFTFNNNGTKIYLARHNATITEHTLSTPYDVSTAGSATVFNLQSGTYAAGIAFNSDGTKLFVVDNDTGQGVYQYNLSTAYDISTASYASISLSISSENTNPRQIAFSGDGSKLFVAAANDWTIDQYSTTAIGFATSETWVNGTNNNEHATLQEALTSQSFNRMNKAQLDAVADGYHFSQDSADTLDLMIAPYATSGTSPISDGVTINYDAASKYKQAINGTEYDVEFTTLSSIDLTSKISANLKVRVL